MNWPDLHPAGTVSSESDGPGGYLHPAYAASFAEFGKPRLLPASQSWILERAIPGSEARDAMGLYPLFCVQNWEALGRDVVELEPDLISLILVTDPFGEVTEARLAEIFPDLMQPFKEHLVADLKAADSYVSKHHRYYARRALDKVTVEHCQEPAAWLNEWSDLYAHLATQHHLSGMKAFSRAAFARQFQVPGLVMLRATAAGETVSAHLFYRQGDTVYSHLAASNERGYELMAAYAIASRALELFQNEARWIDWGAGVGLAQDGADGLTQFKRGWSNTSRTAYLCGRIFNRQRYQELARPTGEVPHQSFFPAYRSGESL